MLNFWRQYGMGFHCSIDGIPEVQNANRPFLGGRSSSLAVEKTAPKILSYRPEVMARATISPKSVPHIFEGAKYLIGLGFRSITFKIAANCNWAPNDFEILREQYRKLGEFYVSQLSQGKSIIIDDFKKGIQELHSATSHGKFPCGAGRGVVLFDPRGDIWPCHRFGPHQCGGQFRLGKIGEQFNDHLRDVILNYDKLEDSKAGCSECRAALTCRSWCYAECVDTTHSFYNPSKDYCQAAQILNDEILLINDRLRSHHAHLFPKILNTR
jgi:uncharacterized protein